jgi:hypothetical protein
MGWWSDGTGLGTSRSSRFCSATSIPAAIQPQRISSRQVRTNLRAWTRVTGDAVGTACATIADPETCFHLRRVLSDIDPRDVDCAVTKARRPGRRRWRRGGRLGLAAGEWEEARRASGQTCLCVDSGMALLGDTTMCRQSIPSPAVPRAVLRDDAAAQSSSRSVRSRRRLFGVRHLGRHRAPSRGMRREGRAETTAEQR